MDTQKGEAMSTDITSNERKRKFSKHHHGGTATGQRMDRTGANEGILKRPPKLNAKETFLYAVLSEQCSDSENIQRFLIYRMGADTKSKLDIKEMTQTELNDKKCCLVTLRFESSKRAASAMNMLHKGNRESSTKTHCYYTKAEALGEKSIIASNHESELTNAFQEIVETAKKTMQKHAEKIQKANENNNAIEETLSKNRNLSATEFDNLSNEKLAIIDKVSELGRQKREFISYVQKMKSKLTDLIRLKHFEKELKNIRTEFGVECFHLDTALPMYARRSDILNTVKSSQVSVILGETGSGKSTQMAQYLYQDGCLPDGVIACTQPRKIAATSLATRVSSELASGVGQVVGYRVGMQSRTSALTKIIYMTDHVLLNDCLVDADLSKYSCIIIDEAHERSIYTDLLLGMLKKAILRRPELKVVITSATIDPDLFVAYFGGKDKCPVLKVSGRTFPVDVVWENNNTEHPFPDEYQSKAVSKALEIHKSTPVEAGDILVFLTSPAETESCAEQMRKGDKANNSQCLQLHGKLKPEEQQKVFVPSPKGKRKVVFATNSAETSITIPGIKFVVDAGVVKEMRFDHKRNMSSLEVVSVSQSSANQRKGRAGRTESGKCYRLYTDEDFETMEKTASPEILRIQVSQAMLKLLALGVDPLNFDYVQAPSREAMENALEELTDIGAVADHTLTELGKWIAAIPVEPKLGAFIKKGIDSGIPTEALVVAGCSSQSGIFYRSGSVDDKKTADRKKMKFCHTGGDLLTALNVYRQWDKVQEKEKGKWCAKNCVNGKAMKGVRDLMNEILSTLKKEFGLEIKHTLKPVEETDEIIKHLIFDSMRNNLAIYLGHENAGYLIVQRKQRVKLHPSSAIAAEGHFPEYVVFGRVLKTSADFMTEVTAVTKTMVEEAVKDEKISVEIDKLEKHKVRLALNMTLGNFIFWKFVGKCHINRRKIEEDICQECDLSPVIIDADKRFGVISLFCLPEYAEKASGRLQSIIQSIAKEILQESKEEYIGNKESGVRALIREGGTTVDILMPNQYRTVVVQLKEPIGDDIGVQSMTETLGCFGPIENIWKRKQKGTMWGKVTFVNQKHAAETINEINQDEEKKIRLSPDKGKYVNRGGPNQTFTLRVTWCRRPAKGVCYFSPKRPEDKVLLTTSTVVIDGSMFSIKMSKPIRDPSKPRSDFFINGLKPYTTHDHVIEGLSGLLQTSLEDCKNRFGNIVIPRTDPPWSQDIHLEKQAEISTLVSTYTRASEFSVNVRELKSKTVEGMAFISFTDWNTCFEVGEGFRVNGQVDGNPITVKYECKSNVYVSKHVYELIKNDLEQLTKEYKESLSDTYVVSRQMKNGNFSVEIKAPSPESLAIASVRIDTLARGTVIGADTFDDLKVIFSYDGRQRLKEVEKKTGTLISTDERQIKITIQGTAKGKSDAISLIEKIVQNMQQLTQNTVYFKGEDCPPGLLKALIMKYGVNFERLKVETGVSSIHLNIRSHSVTMYGEDKALREALERIDDIKKTLHTESHQGHVDKGIPDCPICLCPVDETDISRLEFCGHAYCRICLTSQITSAVSERQFPVVCAVENCNKALVVRDFESQVKGGNISWKLLIEASVSFLVTTKSDTFKYCISPDCEMVYSLITKERIFICPLCQVEICTTCHVKFHDGWSCEDYDGIRKGETHLEKWLKENPDVRKLCPKCGYAIEKYDGCNKMTCKCGAHICWKCLEYFDTSSSCYGHLREKHGGCFDY